MSGSEFTFYERKINLEKNNSIQTSHFRMVISLDGCYLRHNSLTASFNVTCVFIFTYFQCFTTLLGVGVVCGYMSLVTTLIAVACSQFDKLKATILDVREKHITPRIWQEDGQDNSNAKRDLQSNLNVCIRHHQDIIK